jgi:transcriptional regulator
VGKDKADLLQGTLDLLILKALGRGGPMHGYGVSVLIRDWSADVLQVEQGSLYPALYRLEEQGWIESEWGVSENNRRAKYYALTAKGRRQAESESETWVAYAKAMGEVIRAAGAEAEAG